MKRKQELFSGKISTYDKNDFFNNWKNINKNLGDRWDAVVKYSPHKDLKKPTLTDNYFVDAIVRLLSVWLPKKKIKNPKPSRKITLLKLFS